MISVTPIEFDSPDWKEHAGAFPGRTIYQHPAWMAFVAETQHATPLIAELREGNSRIGYFTGLTFHRFGIKVLGSPFPGWTTAYMGFLLEEGVSRTAAISAVMKFAFHELGCAHMECMDRNLTMEEADHSGLPFNLYTSFEVDVRPEEKQILANMSREKRTNLRKAGKNGLFVEESTDEGFAEDYYAQLCDVFHHQGLTPTYSLARVRALIRHMLPTGNLLLLRVRDRSGRCVATNISFGEQNRGYVWGAASFREQQILRPNELIFWHTFRHWKSRGAEFIDLTGNADYKARYGAYRIHLPWFQKSKYPLLAQLRNSARELVRMKQRIYGRLSSPNDVLPHLPAN